MNSVSQPAYILGSARIPFFKSGTQYATVPRHVLLQAALDALVKQYRLQGQLIDDVALGALMNSSTEWNLARECVLQSSLNPESPAYNLQRACGTSLDAVWQIALKIASGSVRLGIAGGVDTNSDMPLEVSPQLQQFFLKLHHAKSLSDRLKLALQFPIRHLSPKSPTVAEPTTHLSMGEHCELMVKEWHIAREEQDVLALASHHNADRAYAANFFTDLVTPFQGFDRDGIVRGDTSLEKLARLKPAFDREHGTLTAGNSSPLTDGAACVLLGNDAAATQLNLAPLARCVDFSAAAVDFVHGAGLLMAPTKAVATLLTRNKLTFDDFDFIEIHEAFAGQVLCNLKAWETPSYCRDVLGLSNVLGSVKRERLNVMGSSIAIGHPFAATGARIVGSLAKLLKAKGNQRGLISICTAGGMGVAAILESV